MVCVGKQECQHDGRHSEKEFWDQPRTLREFLQKLLRASVRFSSFSESRMDVGFRPRDNGAKQTKMGSGCKGQVVEPTMFHFAMFTTKQK